VKNITALDIEEFLPSFVEPFWSQAGVASKIDFRVAPALESLEKLVAEKNEGFDLVFIDADKPGYQAYVEKILKGGLLKEGGVILAVSCLSVACSWSESLTDSNLLYGVGQYPLQGELASRD
jgi:caffeoyl-CoA O-methyltransferase